jgi:Ser/Thr protein kinase RdoA (MazF antagonist)
MPPILPAATAPVAAFAADEATTTLRISTSLRDQAKTYTGTLDVSLKDFTENALWYFIRYKLNPVAANQVEDVPKEVHRLRNQVVGVLKTQEAQYSVPLLQEVHALHERLAAVAATVEGLGGYFAQLHQLLFKIKTIQDICLTTLYYLSGQEEGLVKEVAAQNKGRFESEMAQFEQRLKECF